MGDASKWDLIQKVVQVLFLPWAAWMSFTLIDVQGTVKVLSDRVPQAVGIIIGDAVDDHNQVGAHVGVQERLAALEARVDALENNR